MQKTPLYKEKCVQDAGCKQVQIQTHFSHNKLHLGYT